MCVTTSVLKHFYCLSCYVTSSLATTSSSLEFSGLSPGILETEEKDNEIHGTLVIQNNHENTPMQ